MRRIAKISSRGFSLSWAVGIALAVGLVSGCGGSSPGESGEVLEARLVNDGEAPIHILAPGEDFPSGRLDPGSARSTNVTLSGGGVMFRAGRNGEILAQTICGVLFGDDDAEVGIVVWTPGALTCAGGFGPL